jgi:polyhydroxyalkanoate synthesis regulator phasin
MSESGTQDGVQSPETQDGVGSRADEALLSTDTAERYRNEWEEIQHRFVDEPQSSVEQADRLVEDLMRRLSATFTEERSRLESQWGSGDDVSTEDLRVALTRYRSFFERLLTA